MLDWLITILQNMEWHSILKHSAIFTINILLFVFASQILSLIGVPKEDTSKVKIFRFLNILMLILHAMDIVLVAFNASYQNIFIKLALTLFVLYLGLFLFAVASYFCRKKFGRKKEIDSKKVYFDTYSSRLVGLILSVLVWIIVVYTLIKVWGADSMLETTGIFGILMAFLAFTSSIWAPDIISGLIILNSEMLEDGDIVVIDGYPNEYLINKVSFIYTVLFNVRNNHRTIVKNSRFIQSKIDNLSKIASIDGVRQKLVYNIGYPDFSKLDKEERLQGLSRFQKNLDKMFTSANDVCIANKEVKINDTKPFEWALTSTGDYALEYSLWFYLERIPNTKVTATIRKHLMGTVNKINHAVYEASIEFNVDLSTPDLQVNRVSHTQAPISTYGSHFDLPDQEPKPQDPLTDETKHTATTSRETSHQAPAG